MVSETSLCVVIPAYNEEVLITATLEGIPDYVDCVIVVDDCSGDATVERARDVAARDRRIQVITRERNGGAGAAVADGYRRALDGGFGVIAVMNGDNQMDPAELHRLVEPVAEGRCDYAKANRLTSAEAVREIPASRFLGNAILSMLTKIASGFWHISDSQAGYTAISREALERIDLDGLYPSYGYPNDMLVRLNVAGCSVEDVPSRPIYGIGERSGIRIRRVVPRISVLLLRRFWWRMWCRYVVLDFHPLVFFYAFGALLFTLGVALGLFYTVARVMGSAITPGSAVFVALLVISGLQLLLFAMWFDMDVGRRTRGR